MDLVTRADIDVLAEPGGGDTQISLFMPTHRFGRGIEADRLGWKNLVDGVEAALVERLRRPDLESLLAPARELQEDGMAWQHMSDGLAMFLRPGWERTFRVPAPMPALATVGDHLVLGPMLRQSETRETALPASVSRLQVHNDVGDVRVRPIAAGETPRVSSTTKWGLRRPTSSVTTSGDGAALRGSCPGIAATVCRTDWLVLLPRGTDLKIDQGAGRITLEEPSGDVDIRSGVGSISVAEATASRVSIELGVGDVTYEGIEPPESLDASVGVGDTAVRLPRAVPYRITTSGGAAEVINHLGHDPSAPRSVSVETGVGSITLDPS